jgi:predicted alpha/beta superfamily hydrolase
VKKLSLVVYFVIFSITVLGQKFSPLQIGEKMTIDSKFLKEKTDVWIKFPEDLKKMKGNCSILVILDGDEYFGIASDVENLYQYVDKMPATVIVALPSTIESRWKNYTPTKSKNFTDKKEDDKLFESTGNFPNFANFIREEVIKKIETKYDIKFKSKTIFGHSMGGLAVMSFYKIYPTIFDYYICASPSLTWNNFMFNYYYSDEYPSNSNEKRKIFLSSANPDMNGYKNNVEDLVESLNKKISNSNKVVKYVHYETENHGSSGLRSLIDGLEFVYKKE